MCFKFVLIVCILPCTDLQDCRALKIFTDCSAQEPWHVMLVCNMMTIMCMLPTKYISRNAIFHRIKRAFLAYRKTHCFHSCVLTFVSFVRLALAFPCVTACAKPCMHALRELEIGLYAHTIRSLRFRYGC